MNLIGITGNGWLQIVFFFAVLFAAVKPLGLHMAKVYGAEKTFLTPVLGWLERGLYKISGVDATREMGWRQYAMAMIAFSVVSFLGLYVMLRMQALLPLNPAGMKGISPDLAFNTAVSFLTNTNWQNYGGESTMSYFSQMEGLTVENFLSAAVGMIVMVAMIRGFTRRKSGTIGNFWVDLVRTNLYILLPLSLTLAVALGSQGVIQTFGSYVDAPLVESITQKPDIITKQSIAVGPVASQVAIKQLGTNGGGFFNSNSAHPYENPTPFSNFLEMLALILIPASLTYTFGAMAGDTRQGWALLITMTIIFIPLMLFCVASEQAGNPRFTPLGVDQVASDMQSGGNMEGKETRFGIVNSALFASATTTTSCGAVNSMHDSFTPLGGLVPLILIQFGEVIFGGVGSGMYGMLVFVIITVFISGLMVGRTPEYLGKKINAFDIKMASIAILATPMTVLVGTAIAVMVAAGQAGAFNPGAQGFSEILYAFSSAANNNGSAFAGLNGNTAFYNTALGLAILFGRYFCMIPPLALAGSLAAKNISPASVGTLPTHTPLFIGFLAATIITVGVLNYVPALALGPVAEHFNLMK